MQLTDKIDTLKGIGPKKAQSFVKAGIQNLEDLLCFFPRKYVAGKTRPEQISLLKHSDIT